ncbi:MAG TPA: glutathione S-transferase family protein [Noviherbaspirillum sp.]|uniref:glutathione S-transferase family protein n=1 Tax=Noviherbaspirillum sp. TaxID=1926288 RepID=UPI002B463DAF|nr:glutathione S-transferase family protein [Noviherbaspirillum sp.]HJV88277.1 glutathione S-transferase family protein [Noviherbaspirillum sp.]
MKLVGLFDSPYVRRVAVSLRLYGFDFEHVALSVFRNQDEMRQINPLLKVPMLVLDSGEKLVESSFILDYLDGEVAPEKRLTPASGEARRKVQQQCATALLAVEKAVQIYYETTLRPKEFTYAPWVVRCTEQMHIAFGMLEALPPSPAVSGAPLTQANVTTAVVLRFAQYVLPAEFPAGRYPQLEKLSAYCESLPAFAQTPLE